MDENGLYPSIEKCEVPIYRCKFHYSPDYTPIIVLFIVVFSLFFIIPCFVRTLNKILFEELHKFGSCLKKCVKKKKKKRVEIDFGKLEEKSRLKNKRLNFKGILQDHPVKKGIKNKSIYTLRKFKEEDNDIPYTLREIPNKNAGVQKVKSFQFTPSQPRVSKKRHVESTSKQLIEDEFYSLSSKKKRSQFLEKSPVISNFDNGKSKRKLFESKKISVRKRSSEMDEKISARKNRTASRKLKIKKTIQDEMDEEVLKINNVRNGTRLVVGRR